MVTEGSAAYKCARVSSVSRRGYIIPKSDHICYNDDNVELKIIIIIQRRCLLRERERHKKKMLNEIYTEHILGIIYNIDRSYATIQSIILV